MLYSEECQFFGFHAVFLITARANHHKTVVGGWDHSQEHDVGGPQVLPGGCPVVSRLKWDVFTCFVKSPVTLRGGFGGILPHSRAYLAPWHKEGGFGGILPHSRAYLAPWCQSLVSIGLGDVASVVAALVRRATACDTST